MEDGNSLKVRFGKAVRQLRKDRGLTQMAVCGLTGIDLKYLSNIENGHKNVSICVVERLSKAFGVKISELFRLADTL